MLADLHRAAVPFVWSEYFLERQLPKLLATRALLVVAYTTPPGARAAAPTAVEDHLRSLRAEPPVTRSRLERDQPAVLLAQTTRMLDRLDAVDGVQADDEHLRDARRAYRLLSAVLARDPELVDPAERTRAIGRLGVSAQRVGWAGDALRCAALVETDDGDSWSRACAVCCAPNGRAADAARPRGAVGRGAPGAVRRGLAARRARARIDRLHDPARLIERAHLDAFQRATTRPSSTRPARCSSCPTSRSCTACARAAWRRSATSTRISALWVAVGAGDDRASDLDAIARLRVQQGRVSERWSRRLRDPARSDRPDPWLSLGAALIARGDRVAGAPLAAAGTKLAAAELVEALDLAPETPRPPAHGRSGNGRNQRVPHRATGIDRAATSAFLATVQRTS